MVGSTVRNNYWNKDCPLCGYLDVCRVGEVSYVQPILFSTNEVELGLAPELWKCQNCSSWFSQNIFPENQARELYGKGNAGERWSRGPFDSQKPRAILDMLGHISGSRVRLLDVGCNTGELLDFAKTKGCETSGVEFSLESRKVLRDKGHHDYDSLDKVDNEFDVITAFDLVEHLYDVSGFLNSCRRLLADNGVMVILTGDISSVSARVCKEKWWYLKYPEHIVFPSRKYYEEFSGLHLEKWIRTYASLPYKQSLLSVVRGVIIGKLRKNYIGLPSLGPDHALIVLRK